MVNRHSLEFTSIWSICSKDLVWGGAGRLRDRKSENGDPDADELFFNFHLFSTLLYCTNKYYIRSNNKKIPWNRLFFHSTLHLHIVFNFSIGT